MRRSASVISGRKKEVLLQRTIGQPLGIQLTTAAHTQSNKLAVSIKNIAPESPAAACANLWYAVIVSVETNL